jgi:hypothetical protein
MKQIRILALAIAVIFFAASCSKDKGDKPESNASIIGTWNISHILTIEPNNDRYDYPGEAGDYMEFNNDGTMFTKVQEYEKSEDYQMKDATHLKKGGYDADLKELTNNKAALHIPPHDSQPEDITYFLTK